MLLLYYYELRSRKSKYSHSSTFRAVRCTLYVMYNFLSTSFVTSRHDFCNQNLELNQKRFALPFIKTLRRFTIPQHAFDLNSKSWYIEFQYTYTTTGIKSVPDNYGSRQFCIHFFTVMIVRYYVQMISYDRN